MTLVKDALLAQNLSGKKAQHRLQLDDDAFHMFKQGGIGSFTPGQLAHMLHPLGHTVVVSVGKAQ